MTASIVQNDKIINRIAADPATYVDPEGREVVDGAYQIGWVRKGDGTFGPVQPTVDERKAQIRTDAEGQYAQTLATGFDFDGATFSIADPARRQRLLEIVSQVNSFRNGDASTALPNGKSTVQFFDNSGVAHDFGPVQVVQFGETGNGFVQDADERIAQIMGQIEAATSHSDLENIKVTTGWPT